VTKDKLSTVSEAKEDWANIEAEYLKDISSQILREAEKQGASSAEAAASVHSGISIGVRCGDVETIEYSHDRGFGITVFFGHRKASASTSDLSPESIRSSVETACAMARHTEVDECAGLADPERMATDFTPDLDLWHPWKIEPEAAIGIALEMEQAAFDLDPLITNSEGGNIHNGTSLSVYANSHGFVGQQASSQHSLSCSVLAQNTQSMQRDHAYDIKRCADDLKDHKKIGVEAAKNAIKRLDAKSIQTRQSPVLFKAEVAKSIFGHLVSAASGGSIYRDASFLIGQLEQQIFSDIVQLQQQPFEPRGLRSAHFDSEGVTVRPNKLIDDGRLCSYIMGSYSARRLKLESTGNAGGVYNLTLTPGKMDLEGLIRQMDTGLLVTEVMGQGVNIITGDYSRGCSGFWVEKGKIQQAVEGITIAGNLRDMFKNIVAIGNDTDFRSSIRSSSILIDRMTLGGD